MSDLVPESGDDADNSETDLAEIASEDDAPVPFEDAGTVELPAKFAALKQVYTPPGAPDRFSRARRVGADRHADRSSGRLAERRPVLWIALYLATLTTFSLAIAAALIPFRALIEAHGNGGLDAGVVDEAFAAVAALLVVARLTENRLAADVGFARTGLLKDAFQGILIGTLVALTTLWALEQAQSYHVIGHRARFAVWIPLGVCLAYAVADEAIFRGAIFRVLECRYGSLIALAATAAISTALLTMGTSAVNMPLTHRLTGEALASVGSGLLLGSSYMATRRLWLPIAIQWSWSFFAGPVFGMNLSTVGVVTAAWCHPQLFGSFLRTGSGLGPAASLASCLIWTVAGSVMLRRAVLAGQWIPMGGAPPKVSGTAARAVSVVEDAEPEPTTDE